MLPYNTTVCRLLRQNCQVVRLFKTSAIRQAEKTPIQKYGWDYLMRQRALKRPIAPHINIYQKQLTWMVSGAHRVTGCVMAGTLLIGGILFTAGPITFTQFVEFIRDLHLPFIVTDALKFIIAFPIVFHSLNGIRFIAFDMAKGCEIKTVYKTGYTVLALAALIALIVTIIPHTQYGQRKIN